MLLQLPPLSQIPGPDCVIQTPSPQLGPVIGDVYTTGPISVALELPAEKHRQTNQILNDGHVICEALWLDSYSTSMTRTKNQYSTVTIIVYTD